MKFWGILMLLAGPYILIEWGLLGRDPITDLSSITAGKAPAKTTPSQTLRTAQGGDVGGGGGIKHL